jgi:hypothetical protein
MCAPKNDLAKIALVGAAAYATGGTSLFTSAGTAIQSGIQAAQASSTLQTLASVAKVAAPIIGAGGSIYSGYLNAQVQRQKANFVDYQVETEKESYQLRKVRRARELRAAIGKQRALFGVAGVTLENTPGDLLAQTAANYAEDEFIDTFNTSQNILSKQMSAKALRSEAKVSVIGGYTKAATTLGNRGFMDIITTDTNPKDGGVEVGDAP